MNNSKFYGKDFEKKLTAHLEQNLERACMFLERDVKETFGSGHPIPDVITGRLKGSITHESDGKLKRKFGSSLKPEESNHSYAYLLEWGFTKGGKKFFYPWLRPALKRNERKLTELIGRKM